MTENKRERSSNSGDMGSGSDTGKNNAPGYESDTDYDEAF